VDSTVQYYLDNEMYDFIEDVNGEWRTKSTLAKKSVSKKPVQNKGSNYDPNKHKLLTITKGMIMNDTYRKVFNDKTTIYYFLLSNIVRGEMMNDRLGIYTKYYKKQQLLACTFTERDLSIKCNLTRYKVKKYIKELISSGIIRTEKVWIDDNHSPIIFILGTYSYFEGKKHERLYLDNELDTG
jgi:hypothetical protein